MLVVVGIESGTLLHHLVQVIPVLLALGLVMRRLEVGASAAAALFASWTLIMALVWMYLLGLSEIAQGDYTVAEVVLTLAIAAFSVWGISKSLRMSGPLAWSRSVAVSLGSFAVQAGSWP